MTTLCVTLTYVNLVPVELASLVVSKDIFVIYAGFYIRYMTIPPPVSKSTSLESIIDILLPPVLQVLPVLEQDYEEDRSGL